MNHNIMYYPLRKKSPPFNLSTARRRNRLVFSKRRSPKYHPSDTHPICTVEPAGHRTWKVLVPWLSQQDQCFFDPHHTGRNFSVIKCSCTSFIHISTIQVSWFIAVFVCICYILHDANTDNSMVWDRKMTKVEIPYSFVVCFFGKL